MTGILSSVVQLQNYSPKWAFVVYVVDNKLTINIILCPVSSRLLFKHRLIHNIKHILDVVCRFCLFTTDVCSILQWNKAIS